MGDLFQHRCSVTHHKVAYKEPTAPIMTMVQTLLMQLGKREADTGHERGHTSF